jgi:hypothetical protein
MLKKKGDFILVSELRKKNNSTQTTQPLISKTLYGSKKNLENESQLVLATKLTQDSLSLPSNTVERVSNQTKNNYYIIIPGISKNTLGA